MSIELEDVKYDATNNFIVLKGKVKPTRENIIQAFTQVLELNNSTNCKNVLIDGMETKQLPPPMDIWRLSVHMLKYIKQMLKLRVAYAISDDVSSSFGFFDNYLTNRGVPIQKFNNLEEARKWLIENE